MLKYTVKRLLQSLVTILLIVCTVFLLLRMMPTDYFFTEDELMKLTDKQKEDKLRAAGYLDPVYEQLWDFFSN
ncbi:MAG TPA: ABC transporter permease, partial [Candidatus Fimadaptatus faecigallinarum]|nr:ABC transporter permease [Candidatus Fimadaptatus faecigallinarum]